MAAVERMLAALMREHGDELLSRARLLAGDDARAAELLEKSLVSGLKGRRPRSVSGAYRRVVGAMRHRAARDRTPARTAVETPAPPPAHASAFPVVALAADVDRLSGPARACLVMRYVDGLAAEAIAVELRLDVGRVRGLLTETVDSLAQRHPALGLDPDDAAWGGQEYVTVGGG